MDGSLDFKFGSRAEGVVHVPDPLEDVKHNILAEDLRSGDHRLQVAGGDLIEDEFRGQIDPGNGGTPTEFPFRLRGITHEIAGIDGTEKRWIHTEEESPAPRIDAYLFRSAPTELNGDSGGGEGT